jgi:hypothetical protein
MRVSWSIVLLLSIGMGVLAGAAGQGRDAGPVLAAAREALGGDQALAAVKTFVATGRTRQVRGNNLVPIEFEVACELPAKYVRRDEVPAQESEPTTAGFSGETLIQYPPPPEPPAAAPRAQREAPSLIVTPPPGQAGASRPAGAAAPPGAVPPSATPPSATPPAATKPAGATTPAAGAPADAAKAAGVVPPPGQPGAAGPGGPAAPAGPRPAPPDPRKARLTTLKQDFVKLTLGMFAASFDACPLTFSLFGQAEAPQGTADVVDVKGPDGLALRFFVHSQTHLPIMVSWTTPATPATIVLTEPGQPPPANPAPGSIVVQAPARPAASAPKDEQDKYVAAVQALRKKTLAEAKPIEHRVYYADYRDVGKGLKFPFRLRRSTAGETVEETNFDGFKINARIDPRKFQSVK